MKESGPLKLKITVDKKDGDGVAVSAHAVTATSKGSYISVLYA